MALARLWCICVHVEHPFATLGVVPSPIKLIILIDKMKLYLIAHLLILSFIALGLGIWLGYVIWGVIGFIALQAIGFFIMLKDQGNKAQTDTAQTGAGPKS